MIKIKNKKLIDILAILIVGLIIFLWFGRNEFLGIGDFNIRFDRLKYFKLLFSTWDSTVSFGINSSSQIAQLVPYGVLSIISWLLHIPLSIFERFVVYYWFIIGGIFFYFLLLELKVKRIGRLIGAFFYMMNPFTMLVIWHLPHGRIQEPYSYAPLVLLLFIKLTNKDNVLVRDYVVYALLLFLATTAYSGPNYLLIHMLPVFLYFIVSFIFIKFKKNLFFIYRGMILFILFIILSGFWLIPFLFSISDTISASNLSPIVSNNTALKIGSVSILDALQLKGLWSINGLYKGDYFYSWKWLYDKEIYRIILFLIPIVSIIVFFRKKFIKNRETVFIFILFLASLLLVKGINEPFGFINKFIYDNSVLISSGFRSPFLKFGILLSLSLSVLLGMSSVIIYRYFKKYKYIKYIFGFIFISIFIFINFPFFNGDVIYKGGRVTKDFRVNLPKEYSYLNSYLNNDKSDLGRIMIAPISKTNKTFVNWYNGGYFDKWFSGQHPVINSDTGGSSFLLPDIYATEIEKYNENYNSNFNIEGLLNLMNVKYLLYHKDTNWEYIQGHSWFYNHNKNNVESFINKNTNIFSDKIIDNDYYALYRISNFVDNKIYIPSRTTLFDGGKDNIKNLFLFGKTPSKYAFILKADIDKILLEKDNLYNDYMSSSDINNISLINDKDLVLNLPSLKNSQMEYKLEIPYNNKIKHDISVKESQGNNILNIKNVPIQMTINNSLSSYELDYQIYNLEKNYSIIQINNSESFDSTKLPKLNVNLRLQNEDLISVYKKNKYIQEIKFDNNYKIDDKNIIDASVSYEGISKFEVKKDGFNDGKYSLKLESDNHILAYKETLDLESNKVYNINLWYKNISGNLLQIAIVQRSPNEETNTIKFHPKYENNKEWNNYNIIFPTKDYDLNYLYFYSPSTGEHTVNLIADIEINEIEGKSFINKIKNSNQLYLTDKINTISDKEELILLNFAELQNIDDSSFESNIDENSIVDATISLPGEPDLYVEKSSDSFDGLYSLLLKTNNHTVGYKKRYLMPLDECGPYLVTFSYKNLIGSMPKFSIVERGINNNYSNYSLIGERHNWQTFSKIINVSCQSKYLEFYFYSESPDNNESTNLFDDLKLYKIPFLPQVIGKSNFNNKKNDILPSVNFNKIIDTKYNVKISNAFSDFTLAFLESFNTKWILKNNNYINNNHFKINGYANGWYIDISESCKDNVACKKNADGSYDIEMVIEFWPQRWLYLGLIISGTTLLGCLWYLGYDWRKRRKIRKNKDIKKICQKK